MTRRLAIVGRERSVRARTRDRNRSGTCHRTATEDVGAWMQEQQHSIAVALRDRMRRDLVGHDARDLPLLQLAGEVLAIRLVDRRKDRIASHDRFAPPGHVVERRPRREWRSWRGKKALGLD